jgi:long-chain acyl-CoA synthetase
MASVIIKTGEHEGPCYPLGRQTTVVVKRDSLQDSRQNLTGLIKRSAEKFSNQCAISLGDSSLTYKELHQLSGIIAARLTASGLKKGDRIAILLKNCPEWGAAFFGIMRIGGIAVCMDTFLTTDELTAILEDSEASCAFVSSDLSESLQTAVSKHLPVDKIVDIETVHSLPNASFTDTPVVTDDPAILIYTSGTTGSQKGVVLSHGNVMSNVLGGFDRIPYDPGMCIFSILPLSHMYGITAGLLVPLLNGAKIAYPLSLKADELLKAMKRERAEILVTVPLLLRAFKKSIFERIDQSSMVTRLTAKMSLWLTRHLKKIGISASRLLLRRIHSQFGGYLKYFVCGGAPLAPDIELFFDELDLPILNGYGLTETSPASTMNGHNERKLYSVGRPMPNVNVKLTDANEIIIKGPNVTQGYYKDNKTTSQVIRDGWFHTGDIGEFDADGFLYIRGRVKNVIVTPGGLNIFPEELEEHLLSSPAISEICVLGKANGEAEIPFAFIFPNQALMRGLTFEQQKTRIKKELDAYQDGFPLYKKVQAFELCNHELPKTTTKKIKRKALLNSRQEETPRGSDVILDNFASNLRTLLAKIVDSKDETDILMDSNLDVDLGIDSLMKIEVLCSIEKEMSIHIPDDSAFQIETFADLVMIARRYHDTPGCIQAEAIFANLDKNLSDIINDKWYFQITRKLSSFMTWTLARFYCRLKVIGRGKIPAGKSFIIAGNHSSLTDFPLIFAALPGRISHNVAAPAAKDFFFEKKTSAFLLQAAYRAFPLARYGNFMEGLKVCARIIRTGKSIILFPEGGRSPDGEIMDFKPGIAMLSFELDVQILPVYITGASNVLPRGTRFPRPRKVTVSFGDPVNPKDYAEFKGNRSNYDIYQMIIAETRNRVLRLKESHDAQE